MANLLKGKDVAASIIKRSQDDVALLKEKGISPKLAVFRIGNKEDDIAYERNIEKKALEVGVEIKKYLLNDDASEEELLSLLDEANKDTNIHGILIFRPLPKNIDDQKIRNFISPNKDIDGCGDLSLAGVFTNTKLGFAPCTAKAAIEILDYYKIDITGKNVVVLGRSLVIGKPVSMLLLNRNATVTICHTKTKDIQEIAKTADILICATGKMESINKDYVSSKQTIIDVGISWNPNKNKLCGDVLFEDVEGIVENITPVPGGVGSVTTAVLISNVVEAAKRQNHIQ